MAAEEQGLGVPTVTSGTPTTDVEKVTQMDWRISNHAKRLERSASPGAQTSSHPSGALMTLGNLLHNFKLRCLDRGTGTATNAAQIGSEYRQE